MSGLDLSQATWRKSSRSGEQGGACVEVASVWRKSSRSSEQGGMCVEVAPAWRKSRLSGDHGGNCVEVAAAWQKSSQSDEQGVACVEVAVADRAVAVRDSKDPHGPVLCLAPAAWGALINELKHTLTRASR